MHENQITSQPRVALQTLGCKLNYAETSQLARQFSEHGYLVAPIGPETRVFVLNTCSVTYNAERESRLAIRRVMAVSPEAFIIVVGCYAQLRPEEIASITGVDLVLGAKEKLRVFDLVDSFAKRDTPLILSGEIADVNEFEFSASDPANDRTRAFLKVQDGCDYNCSFCTIPAARGGSRSGKIEQIVAEARRLSREGFREIVLTGVNVGDFGRKNGTSLLELVTAIDSEPEINARFRISSIEPNLLTEELVEAIAESKRFCHHFHIPLQSGSASVLRRMQRRYGPDLYRAKLELVKRRMPEAAIGADVIVGFPGESEVEFAETEQFIIDSEISYLHVFTYSERPSTLAATLGAGVSSKSRAERNRILRVLSEKKREAFHQAQKGSLRTVVIEHASETCGSNDKQSISEGYTENYVRVQLDEPVEESVGLVRVELLGPAGGMMLAKKLAVLGERLRDVRVTSGLLPILASA